MKTMRIFGYIILVIAAFLALPMVERLPQLFVVIFGVFKVITGQMDSYHAGEVMATFTIWVFYFAITISLFVVGRRWTKKQIKKELISGKLPRLF